MFKISSRIFGIAALFLVFMPQNTYGAELLFNASPDSRVIEVTIDPQSKQMNVAEGTIEFSGLASDGLSVQIENGQSVFPIWPTPPRYDQDKKSIVFVGGVPNGFESKGLLFRLRLSSSMSGDLMIRYVDGNGYLNDGKGTKELISSKPLELYLGNEGMARVGKDSSGRINKFEYAIIILLVAGVILAIFHNVYKKNHKQ